MIRVTESRARRSQHTKHLQFIWDKTSEVLTSLPGFCDPVRSPSSSSVTGEEIKWMMISSRHLLLQGFNVVRRKLSFSGGKQALKEQSVYSLKKRYRAEKDPLNQTLMFSFNSAMYRRMRKRALKECVLTRWILQGSHFLFCAWTSSPSYTATLH